MTMIDHSYVEKITGKAFDGNSTPTDDDVDTLCIEAQAILEGLLKFEIEEVTETDELIDVKYPTAELNIKYPIITFTSLEERTNDTYEAKTEGPTEDFTVDKVNGILKAACTWSTGKFLPGLQRYQLNYSHGLESTDNIYKMAERCIGKMVQAAVLEVESGGSGYDVVSSFGVGGLNVSFKGEDKVDQIMEEVRMLIRGIRGEWRAFADV